MNEHNPIAASKVLFQWMDDGVIGRYIGFKSSGFVVRYPNGYYYITAGHCFGNHVPITSDELMHLLLMQPGEDGSSEYVTFDQFLGTQPDKQRYELDDIVALRVRRKDEKKVWGYIDHSNPPTNAMTDGLHPGDKLILSGWYYASDLELLDEDNKIVKHWPSTIPLVQRKSGDLGMNEAIIDIDLAKSLGYSGESLSGISGSAVWKQEVGGILSWAGVALQSASGIVRYLDSRMTNPRWLHYDRIGRRA